MVGVFIEHARTGVNVCRYGDWTTLSGTVEKYIRTTNAILQLGCGNSALADSLYDNGYRNVTSTDAASTAIRQQVQRNSSARPTLVFEVADATKVRAADADAASPSYSCHTPTAHTMS